MSICPNVVCSGCGSRRIRHEYKYKDISIEQAAKEAGLQHTMSGSHVEREWFMCLGCGKRVDVDHTPNMFFAIGDPVESGQEGAVVDRAIKRAKEGNRAVEVDISESMEKVEDKFIEHMDSEPRIPQRPQGIVQPPPVDKIKFEIEEDDEEVKVTGSDYEYIEALVYPDGIMANFRRTGKENADDNLVWDQGVDTTKLTDDTWVRDFVAEQLRVRDDDPIIISVMR